MGVGAVKSLQVSAATPVRTSRRPPSCGSCPHPGAATEFGKLRLVTRASLSRGAVSAAGGRPGPWQDSTMREPSERHGPKGWLAWTGTPRWSPSRRASTTSAMASGFFRRASPPATSRWSILSMIRRAARPAARSSIRAASATRPTVGVLRPSVRPSHNGGRRRPLQPARSARQSRRPQRPQRHPRSRRHHAHRGWTGIGVRGHGPLSAASGRPRSATFQIRTLGRCSYLASSRARYGASSASCSSVSGSSPSSTAAIAVPQQGSSALRASRHHLVTGPS